MYNVLGGAVMEKKYSPKTRDAGTAAKRSIKIRIKKAREQI